MKGIYLGAYKAEHSDYNIIYQDINGLRDIDGCMLDIDLSEYDFIIATPPCNFWSHARGHKQPSNYALNTAHLLPDIIDKLKNLNKPFIVENVRNKPLFTKYGLYDKKLAIYHIGRHTYWSNMLFNSWCLQFDDNIQNINPKDRQGGINVHIVIDRWLYELHNYKIILI